MTKLYKVEFPLSLELETSRKPLNSASTLVKAFSELSLDCNKLTAVQVALNESGESLRAKSQLIFRNVGKLASIANTMREHWQVNLGSPADVATRFADLVCSQVI